MQDISSFIGLSICVARTRTTSLKCEVSSGMFPNTQFDQPNKCSANSADSVWIVILGNSRSTPSLVASPSDECFGLFLGPLES